MLETATRDGYLFKLFIFVPWKKIRANRTKCSTAKAQSKCIWIIAKWVFPWNFRVNLWKVAWREKSFQLLHYQKIKHIKKEKIFPLKKHLNQSLTENDCHTTGIRLDPRIRTNKKYFITRSGLLSKQKH